MRRGDEAPASESGLDDEGPGRYPCHDAIASRKSPDRWLAKRRIFGEEETT
jgi:hypothetical protein